MEVPTAGLGRALHYWTNAPGYLTTVAAGETRRNLYKTERVRRTRHSGGLPPRPWDSGQHSRR